MMNMASFMVLSIVTVLLILSIVSSRKESTGKCSGNCSECVYSCHEGEIKP